MRSKEFINEGTGSLAIGVSAALPATWTIPRLTSQDPYLQYRFGLALAAARAVKAGDIEYPGESIIGEKMVVSAFSKEEEETLALALELYGEAGLTELISSRASEESKDVYKQSPVISYKRKLNKL